MNRTPRFFPFAPLAALILAACVALPSASARADDDDSNGFAFGNSDHFRYRVIDKRGNGVTVESDWGESWNSDEPGFYFELDGKRYVIHDRGYVRRALEITEPMREIGRKQGEIGRQQARIGIEQAKLGRYQARLGALQGRLGALLARLNLVSVASDRHDYDHDRADVEDEMGKCSDQQHDLAERHRPLSERQSDLGRQQGELGRQQRRALANASHDLEELAKKGLREHVAERDRD